MPWFDRSPARSWSYSDPFFTGNAARIAALGTKAGVPAIYPARDYAESGGLMSYGADVRDEYRKAGTYAGRLLQGEAGRHACPSTDQV